MIKIPEVLQIQAARSAVWQHFADIEGWHTWNQEVLSAGWIAGTPWQEGSIFAVEHFTVGGVRKQTPYAVRMCVLERNAVYESTARFPLSMLSSVQLTDSLGGCRLEAIHSYSGPASPLIWLLSGRQKTLLRRAMLALKERVERPQR